MVHAFGEHSRNLRSGNPEGFREPGSFEVGNPAEERNVSENVEAGAGVAGPPQVSHDFGEEALAAHDRLQGSAADEVSQTECPPWATRRLVEDLRSQGHRCDPDCLDDRVDLRALEQPEVCALTPRDPFAHRVDEVRPRAREEGERELLAATNLAQQVELGKPEVGVVHDD